MKKRWIVLALTVLFLWAVVSRFTELEQLKNTLAQGKWELVLAAMAVQVVYYIAFTWTYQSAFDTVGVSARIRDLLPVTLGSLFVNVVVPVGGAGGAALFAEDLSRRGKPAARSAAGVLLQLISDFTAFTLILIPGMIYLFIEHDLKIYEISGAVILLLLTFGLSSILLVGIWKPDWLRRLFGWSHRTANWIFGRLNRSLSLADDWAQKNAEEFSQASAAVASHPSRLMRTVGIAFLAHLVDISCLFILFLAFNQPIGLGALVAGYAVGILFWIVSITPQGIGVVEGVMALTFTSLGIPGAVATTVVLAFRGLTFWLPMTLGFFAVQRLHTVGADRHTLTEKWGVRFAAILVALMGIVNILSAVTPSLTNRLTLLENFLPLEVRHGGHLTAALAGFALLILAGNLGRRKLVAWMLTLLVLGISMVSHLVKGLDYEEALLAGGLMVMLWLMRNHFHARSDHPSIRQGLRVLAGASLFTMAYGVAGFFLLDRHYSVNFGLWDAFWQTVVMFTEFYDPGLVPVTHFGSFFADSIYFVGAATIGYAVVMLLRPVFVREPTTNEERQKARTIVERYGRSSLARFLLLDDKRYFFSPGGSVIGYALAGRAAVALGDPVGPDDDLLPSIEAFTSLCKRNDWLPVFYQTQPRTLDAYKSAGFDALSIGNEGVVNLDTFTLEGKEGKALRSPINKLKNAGYKFIVHEPPIPDELLEELRAISDEWLTMMHGSEKRFSLGWFDDEYIRTSPIGAVYAPEGWISAFVNFVPEYQLSEATVDLMRRRPEIENGTMEFLFVSLFQWAKVQGYHGFNLGLSSLSGVGEQPTDQTIEKVMHFVYEHVNQFYNFKGLHSFKEKFHPEWSPRYLVYRGTANLAQSWLAVMQASAGDDNFVMSYLKIKR
ncbi:Phosphatidylglycerol lysyltransferase [Anaerolineales bacterium]|nr:Phosphatidylglycerol lysyltransferase [Anaerolineales bacterium]